MVKHIKKIIKQPVKSTLIILAVTAALFLTLSSARLMQLRVLNAECGRNAECAQDKNGPAEIVLSDLVFITRILTELGLILLAVQLIYRVVTRK